VSPTRQNLTPSGGVTRKPKKRKGYGEHALSPAVMQSFVVTLEAIKADNPSSRQMQSIIETAEEFGYQSPTGAMGTAPQTLPRPAKTLMKCIDGYMSEHKHITIKTGF
jgi:hypothetical protein